jgi:hypothetical protein
MYVIRLKLTFRSVESTSPSQPVLGVRNVIFALAVEQYVVNLNPTCIAG